MIGDISYTEPFCIDDTTYNYQVKGILYAESKRSAQLGLQAYLRLPRDTQFFLLNEVDKGLVILCRDQQTISDDNQAIGVVSYSRHLKAIVSCGRVFSENATIEAKRDAICLKFGTGELPLETITGTLVHELDHYFRWVTGKALRHALTFMHQIDHPTEPLSPYLIYHSDIATNVDPTYLTRQRKQFQKAYFDDMLSYIKKNNIQSILSVTDPVAINLFAHPMGGYFFDAINAGIRHAQIEKKIEINTEYTGLAILKAEEHWLQSDKPISILVNELHKLHPMLSLKKIRQVVSCASLIARVEISAFHAESVFCFGDEAVKAVAPRLTSWLADITAQRVKLIKYTFPIQPIENQASPAAMNSALHRIDGLSANRSAYLAAAGSKSSQRTTNDLYKFFKVNTPKQTNTIIGRSFTPQSQGIPLSVSRINPPGNIPSGKPAKSSGQLITSSLPLALTQGQPQPTGQGASIAIKTFPPVKQAHHAQDAPKETITIEVNQRPRFSTKASKNIAKKSLAAAALVENVIEYGDPYAGLVATSVQIGTMRALQLLSPLPLLPLTIAGALPDVKDTYDETIASLEGIASDKRELTESERVNNILVWGNPWGPDRGLTRVDMSSAQKAAIVMRTDPEPFVGYHLQKVGQGINQVVMTVAKAAASGAAILNPFSSTSKLDSAERYRPENQPGYVFVDALRFTEVETRHQPFLVQDIYRQEIVAILTVNQPEGAKESLSPIEHPVDPQQIQREATYVPGYVGPKFHFKNDHIPDWVQGAGVVGSLGTGWKVFLTTQLSFASFGAGLALLTVSQVISHFINKHKQSKQNIRARNSRRVNEQCDVIKKDIDKVTTCIDKAIELCNRFLSETNPEVKQALYTQFSYAVAEAKAVNQSQRDLNAQRMSNKDIRVDGHKIRLRTRRYCEEIHSVFSENEALINELECTVIEHQSYTEKNVRLQSSLKKIDQALLENNFDLAVQCCLDSEISDSLKADMLLDIKNKKCAYLDRQLSLRLSIGSDAAGLIKNTLTLFMPSKANPPVSIPMTKVKNHTPANAGLWKQQKTTPDAVATQTKAAVKKLPVAVSDEASTIKKPVKAFKL